MNSKRRINSKLLVALAISIVLIIGIGGGVIYAVLRDGSTGESEAKDVGQNANLSASITHEAALAEFEKSHDKYSSIEEAIDAVPTTIKSEVRQPKDSLGATLVCVYVAKPEMASGVSLRYSNDMEVSVIPQESPVDYAGLAQYMHDLDAQGYGSHTTQAYVTSVNGFQAIALDAGKNAGGSQYASYVQWSSNGTQHKVSSSTLSAEELIKVAASMY